MLIVCKECGKQYSSEAKKCPNCGCPSEYRGGKKKLSKGKKIGIGIAVVLVLALVFGGNDSDTKNNSNTSKTNNTNNAVTSDNTQTSETNIQDNTSSGASDSSTDDTYSVGDSVISNNLKYTLTDVAFEDSSDGQYACILLWTVENVGDEEETTNSCDLYLDGEKAQDNYWSGYDSCENRDGLTFTSISGGKTAKLCSTFTVPKKNGNFEVELEADMWTKEKYTFKFTY